MTPRHFEQALRRLFTALTRRALAWQARRADADLRGMSDHELKDLGIGRSEVMHWRNAALPPGRTHRHSVAAELQARST